MATGRCSPNLMEIIANFVHAEWDATSEIVGKRISEVTREFMGLTCLTICEERVDEDFPFTDADVSHLEAIEAMECVIAENREADVEWGPEDINVSSFDMVNGDVWSDNKPEEEKNMEVLIEIP